SPEPAWRSPSPATRPVASARICRRSGKRWKNAPKGREERAIDPFRLRDVPSVAEPHLSRKGAAAFVEIEKLEHRVDRVLGQPGFAKTLMEQRSRFIFPPALAHEPVPHLDFLFGRPAAVGKHPLENLLIGSAFESSRLQRSVIDA